MLAIIGGNPARFAPFSQLFQRALSNSGARVASGAHAPGHVDVTDEQARSVLAALSGDHPQRQQDPWLRHPGQRILSA
jgi:hypothetical protein